MASDQVCQLRVLPCLPGQKKFRDGRLSDAWRFRDSQQLQIPVFQILQGLHARQELFSPRHIELSLRFPVLLDVNTKAVEPVRRVKQMALEIQVQHLFAAGRLLDLICRCANLPPKRVRRLEVLIVENELIASRTDNLHAVFRFQRLAQLQRVLQRLRILRRDQLTRGLLIAGHAASAFQHVVFIVRHKNADHPFSRGTALGFPAWNSLLRLPRPSARTAPFYFLKNFFIIAIPKSRNSNFCLIF